MNEEEKMEYDGTPMGILISLAMEFILIINQMYIYDCIIAKPWVITMG